MSIDSFDSLPEPLDIIADAVGLEATLKLADAYGGTRISIPARINDDHWLSQLVGLDAAKGIAKAMMQTSAEGRIRGSGEIILPRGPANIYAKAKAQFYKYRNNGISIRECARKLNVHERTCFRWERLKNSNDNQLFLFD